ncbi:hypothetical protein EXA23_12110 [Vibrio cincinnatiensis]|uniref:UvrD-helicase domain-containing protein n=1 Tax=Vibrio TaxID=662 RepID=UPI001302C62E|nr:MULTISPECIES: UvrD-helicase domain-containing protein [Vibrio]EKO3569421.1 UvrD-helicase domain-containing protein [Vibrio metschnikovii]EKO3604238.1 UvrD-helicase domain-containing protein [Vibrio metschnikovii]EKO3615021.1 UvrD-helicase domain-containing protein [Vibrio metschnikovii]EKO3635944.1 UvrD-helicase domain-containing protein [Vibrio metschnikovii]EKO3652889.1 UvrD-helicase domain-containing protein [Vibrio metschnikovii]
MSSPNKNQQIAIHHYKGPLLIIAGPGSGKTYTLVERIINLINVHHAAPEQLFVVTFTEKAAQELKTRISNRILELGTDFNVNEMYLGTRSGPQRLDTSLLPIELRKLGLQH